MTNLDDFKSIPPHVFTYVTLNHDLFNLQKCHKRVHGKPRENMAYNYGIYQSCNKMLVGSIATIISLRFWQFGVFGC
jgi:hypothetical protein